ncbi:hypothetical protein FJT64_025152 [Amphibalanus amphitrite]|uniref:Retrotransposon gag domain-containing protein n=1 Tax=Amphibalanus amphitrite TaxID=1232801 RepID=A0A6A4W8F2_AMPAM|nr:hypothetical protein FJT64_025152 [Amphibalanus amphitrite]
MLRVGVSDFPVYDGSVPPDDFIAQCRRLTTLGGIPADQLPAIMTVRCRGMALQVLEGDGGQTDVTTLLQKAFGDKPPEAAAAQLSAAQKGTMPVLEYSVLIRRLVRGACPEFFGDDGAVKKICVPAHQAALYRHFLVGLSTEEKILLSRQGVKSFDAAIEELRREELIGGLDDGGLHHSRRVRVIGYAERVHHVSPRQPEPTAGGDGGSDTAAEVNTVSADDGRSHHSTEGDVLVAIDRLTDNIADGMCRR